MSAAPSITGAAELELALRATLLIGAAWTATALLRKARSSAATRHMAWLLGIAALLALPLIWWLAPPLRLPILGPEETSTVSATFAPPTGADMPMPADAPNWGHIIFVVYLLGVAALLLRFALSRRLVSRLWSDAEPAQGVAWRELVSGAARELRLSRPVQLRIARGPAMPMTWGTVRPKILLPAEAQSWRADRRRLVLLHELAHVARRDSLSRSAASLVCALYWFHPGIWFAARQLRLEQEHAADDRVLTAGAPARSYARNLLDLALRVGGKSWPDHAAAMAGMCQLERRVISITTNGHREPPSPAFVSASVVVATCIMLAMSAAIPVRPLATPLYPLGIDTGSPAPAESMSGRAMPMPNPAMAAPRSEDRPRGVRDGFGSRRTTARPFRAESRPTETEGQQIDPAGRAHQDAAPAAISLYGHDATPSLRQLSGYGPQLPQPNLEERDSASRIPAALRPGNLGRSPYPGRSGRLRFIGFGTPRSEPDVLQSRPG